MKYACEMAEAIVAKKIAEEEAKRQAELAAFNKAMEKFRENLPAIDEVIEKALLENDGKVEILIDTYCETVDGFCHFAKRDNTYGSMRPYWINGRLSKSFHLDTYIQYLKDHCYNVEIIEKPFTGYSSTGKSTCQMDGITMVISI